MMKPDKHQELALRTWYQKAHILHWDKLPSGLGLVGESGELTEALLNLVASSGNLSDEIKKDKYKPNYQTSIEKMREELVDVWYYVRILAYQLGMDTEEMTRRSADKLLGGKHGWYDNTEIEY